MLECRGARGATQCSAGTLSERTAWAAGDPEPGDVQGAEVVGTGTARCCLPLPTCEQS